MCERRDRSAIRDWFGVEAQFWLNRQTQFDLIVAEQSIGAAIKDLPPATARA